MFWSGSESKHYLRSPQETPFAQIKLLIWWLPQLQQLTEEVKDMEWHRSDSVDDIPINKCARSSFPSQKRWKQWGLDTIDEGDVSLDKSYAFGDSVADEGDSSCETLVDVDQLEMDSLVGEADQAEISGVQGGISETSNCWTELLNNQDYQLDGFPWTNENDENFLNSLLVDDLHASDQFYDSSKSQGTYSAANNLTTDMMLDSHDIRSYEQIDSPRFPCKLDWDKEQFYASHHNLQNMIISAASHYNEPLGNIPQQACADRIVSENPSVEESVLQEFGSAVQKITHKSRLCFRDAMYRLATSSEIHSSVLHGEPGDNISLENPIKPTNANQTLRFSKKDATEPITNKIDRTIADLLFNKPYQHGDWHQDLNLAAKPHDWHLPKLSQLTLQPAFIM